MHKESVQTIYDIYENDVTIGQFGKKITEHNPTRNQSSELTESDCVKSISSRATLVCLALVCFLLLTAVIMLSAHSYMKHTQERELLTKITNITEERDKLTVKNANLLNDREQLKIKTENLTNQLNNALQFVDGLIFSYQFSVYFVPNDTKNWTESRRDCQRRGADLLIINNREENEFIMNVTRGKECWIGLTDSEVEGTWKWADGSIMTSGFWASNAQFTEPNGSNKENCVVTYIKSAPTLLGWIDDICSRPYQRICEKRLQPLTQP